MKIIGVDFHIHKWDCIYKECERSFMGVKYTELHEAFRVCSRCGEVEKRGDYPGDSYWVYLNEKRSEIVKDKIKNESYTTDDGKVVLNYKEC